MTTLYFLTVLITLIGPIPTDGFNIQMHIQVNLSAKRRLL